MKKLFFLSFILLFFFHLQAQEYSLPSIVTDRPDQTESSKTVPKNTFQIEMGFSQDVSSNKMYENKTSELGSTLLRYGVWDNFELRLASFYGVTNMQSMVVDFDTTYNGLGPLSAGFKVYIIEESGLRPEIALLADITMRHIGDESYAPTYSYPTALMAFSHTLSDKFSLGYNTGFGYNGENADGFFIYSMVVGYGITDKLSFFAESYGNFDHGNLPNNRIDGGFTYLVANNFQLDLSAGMGLDKDNDQYFVSVGYAWRIPR